MEVNKSQLFCRKQVLAKGGGSIDCGESMQPCKFGPSIAADKCKYFEPCSNGQHEPHEIVVIELDMSTRLRVSNQIDVRMIEIGFEAKDYAALDLGFELGPCWPLDRYASVTLPQLVVVANKLGLRITINDLNFSPLLK